MLGKNKKDVLAVYLNLKNTGNLSANLINPTIANLRNECAAVFSKRPEENIKSILQSFAERGFQISEAQDILTIDSEKFKPLQKYMKGQIGKPNTNTLVLLAWLIGFDENVDKVQPLLSWSSKLRSIFAKYPMIIIMSTSLCGFILYKYIGREKCMYWTGVEYKTISCEEGVKYNPRAIMINKEKLTKFKRITTPDTLTYYSIDKVWYAKIDSFPEFYTISGMHPVDEKRILKPVSKYIIDKYILKKKLDDTLKINFH